jgi:hypothetical protein
MAAKNERYAHRIYVDQATNEGLERIAQQLGFVVTQGPTVGMGSKQEFLAHFVQVVVNDETALEQLRALLAGRSSQ